MKLSVVIPVYNEQDSLKPLTAELELALGDNDWEVIFINDGSTDLTWDILNEICEDSEKFSALHLTQNSGKSAAYMAGFSICRGDLIITLDGDLQDDPAEIRKLRKKLDSGFDLVVGWKKGRVRNEWQKTLPSKFYNSLKATLFGLSLTDSNCGFRIMRRAVMESLDLYGDRYRFIPELSHLAGFRVAEVAVRHRKRAFGVSKYGAARFYTGLMDLFSVRFVTLFSAKPLQFFGLIALPMIFMGGLLETYVLIQKLAGSNFQTHVAALLVGIFLLLGGLQFLCLELMGEMMAFNSAQRKLPSIKSKSGQRFEEKS